MREIDRRTAEAHLVDALQHLATAGVVLRYLDRAAELDHKDRLLLIRSAQDVQSMLDQVTRTLRSRTIDLRIAELLDAPDDTPA